MNEPEKVTTITWLDSEGGEHRHHDGALRADLMRDVEGLAGRVAPGVLRIVDQGNVGDLIAILEQYMKLRAPF